MTRFESVGIDHLNQATTEDELYDTCQVSCNICKKSLHHMACGECLILRELNLRIDAIEELHGVRQYA